MARKSRFIPLKIGDVFGRLEVVEVGLHKDGKLGFVLCLCRCGTKKLIYGNSVQSGLTRSCGCFAREKSRQSGLASRKHGESTCGGKTTESHEYRSWRGMKRRCYEKQNHNYHRYGARGITVCGRWLKSYENFLADVGRAPTPKHTLDRWPDKNGNYEPGNVRWANAIEQGRNRRNNHLLTVDGVTRCITEWAELSGIPKGLIRGRVCRGMEPSLAIFKPVRAIQRKPQ